MPLRAPSLDELGDGREVCRESEPLRAPSLYVTRNQERKACDDTAERLLLPLDADRGRPIESVAQVVDVCQLSRHAVDEKRSHGRRCLEARMGHEVDHRVVAFVADAGDDR